MNPIGKAIWYIEAHLSEPMELSDIAEASGVSRYHLSRAFGLATGWTVMGYLRGRRLTEAAKSLAGGAPDILAVAVEAGYGSHEAFTRAFREQFGTTPESARENGGVDAARMAAPIHYGTAEQGTCSPPRLETAGPQLLAGLNERYTAESASGIPAQWQRFVPYLGYIPGQIGQTAYGVLHNADGGPGTDYLCAVEVRDSSSVPSEFFRLRLPRRSYAVFLHTGHISTIYGTWSAAWNGWAPDSGRTIADAPEFERYTERFNGQTGLGGVEIWIPLEE